MVIRAEGVAILPTRARVLTVNFKAQGLKKAEWAMVAVAVLTKQHRAISPEMLDAALKMRFKGAALAALQAQVSRLLASPA